MKFEISSFLSFSGGQFWPAGIGIRILNPDLDPPTHLNPDSILFWITPLKARGKTHSSATNVADPVPPGPFQPRDLGSGKRFFRIPDTGYQTHIFERLVTIFWKRFYSIILSELAQISSLRVQKLNNFKFCEICVYKKQDFFPLLFCCCCRIWDPV